MVSQPGRIDVDYRIGNVPRHYLRFDENPLMQVPDEVRKCVAFLICKHKGSYHPAGTAFLVGTPMKIAPEHGFVYMVTAKHVIDGIRDDSDDQRVYIRLNTLASDTIVADVSVDDWCFHPNDLAADVAVIPFNPEGTDSKIYPIPSFVTDDTIEKEGIGVGDEVFMVGLFIPHTGRKQNLPILRAGNIAAMPEEPIDTENGLMEAYLIEARSIGGLSGSPVFVHFGIVRYRQGQTMYTTTPEATFLLLGLMHGHWDLPTRETDAVLLDQAYNKSVNMGIGIVVPAKKILETINHPELEQMRMEAEKDWKKQTFPTLDSSMKENQEEKPFTREDFEDALKKVSNPQKEAKTDGSD